jgi:hypothetical protein
MRYIFLLTTILAQLTIQAQDCRLVRQTTKKSADTKSKGGSAQSKDYLLLYLEKNYDPKNPSDTVNYSAMIIMGSRYELKDSIINAGGKFEFYLSNGETSTWDKAVASNLGDVLMTPYPNNIMFKVRGTKRQLEPLTKYYINKVRVYDILETDFGTKSQKQLLTIADCLSKSGDTLD